MKCKHFGSCGSCSLYELEYSEALIKKKESVASLIESFYSQELEVFNSPKSHHRARAEFKIWHIDDKAHYAMTNIEKNGVTILQECPKVVEAIERVQYKLLEAINSSEILRKKLFSIEFLSGKSGEVLATLIYHKKLDESWEAEAKALVQEFDIFIIGRARKQKIVLSQDYITEELEIDGKEFKYRYYEGGFTQPNPYVNEKMISWALNCAKSNGGDLIELYCGLGNFTLPLSQYFDKVLATEISSNSIKAAKENCIINNINNIEFVRLNASETAQALKKVREFRRLRGVDLDSFNFTTALVDPPRAGLDEDSTNLIKNYENIIYISCNPETLARDLEVLTKTHQVVKGAVFDQFPYTSHIESGVYLKRVSNG